MDIFIHISMFGIKHFNEMSHETSYKKSLTIYSNTIETKPNYHKQKKQHKAIRLIMTSSK